MRVTCTSLQLILPYLSSGTFREDIVVLELFYEYKPEMSTYYNLTLNSPSIEYKKIENF